MLTVRLERLELAPGVSVLDIGAGKGRHSLACAHAGALSVAVDLDPDVLRAAAADWQTYSRGPGSVECVSADALELPFASSSFDIVIASEVLEHIEDDSAAVRELARVLKPGGSLALSVPRFWPEKVCWTLSEAYRSTPGGHVRIYRRSRVMELLSEAGLRAEGSHHAHSLHSPYWWLRCAIGIEKEDARLPSLYHRFLVWDLMKRPLSTRALGRALDPLLGKSLVAYARKPAKREEAAYAA